MQKTLIVIQQSSEPDLPETVHTYRWLAVFAAVIIATIITVSYLEGGIDESLRESRDVSDQISVLRAQNGILQQRFDILADSAGEGAILEAGIRFQQFQEARQ